MVFNNTVIIIIFSVLGLAGCAAIVAYQLYKMKSRGNTKMSVYLIHTRVAAQGFVVGSMTLGKYHKMLPFFLIFTASIMQVCFHVVKCGMQET